jgi:hypothetical protein
MLTYVPLANVALQHLGESDRIAAPDENSKGARAVKAPGKQPGSLCSPRLIGASLSAP